MNLERYYEARRIGHQPFRSACYAPFVSMSFDQYGMVSICSFTRTTPLGRVGDRPLAEMWNGATASMLREAVEEDRLDGTCSRCLEEIEGGNVHGLLATGFDRFTADRRAPWPRRMEFALSTQCNLRCVMCSGEFSSSIRSRREGLPALPERYGDAFMEEIRPFLAHLEQARFLGGEPFLAEVNHRIWRLLAEEAPDVECNVTTNGTVWNHRVAEVLERLRFSIGISIDGITRETVERVREGASFDRVMSNVERFLAYRGQTGASVSLTYCLMTENWHEFGRFLEFAEERGCQVYVNTVRQPPQFSLYRLPTTELRDIVEHLEDESARVAARLERNRAAWTEQLERLRHHLDGRQGPDRFGDVGAPPRGDGVAWDALAQWSTQPDLSEAQLVEGLGEAADGGQVSVIRCGGDDCVTVADRYLGLDVTDLVGRPAGELMLRVAERHGTRIDVHTEHVQHGAVCRVVSFTTPAGDPTFILSLTRRDPSTGGTTRIASMLRRGSDLDHLAPSTPVRLTGVGVPSQREVT